MSIDLSSAELIRRALDSRLGEVYVCLPGLVQSYDSATQTASIKPLIQRLTPTEDGILEPETEPTIPNVQVIFPRSKSFHFHFDLVAGDTVALVFSQRSTQEWRSTGLESAPTDARLHSPSYPIAIPGWYPALEPIPLAATASEPFIGAVTGPKLFFGTTIEARTDLGTPAPAARADHVSTELGKIQTAFSGLIAAIEGATAGGNPVTWVVPSSDGPAGYTPGSVAATTLVIE